MSGRRDSLSIKRNDSPLRANRNSLSGIDSSKREYMLRKAIVAQAKGQIGLWWNTLPALHLKPQKYGDAKFLSICIGILTMVEDNIDEEACFILERFAVLLPALDDVVDGVLCDAPDDVRLHWLDCCVTRLQEIISGGEAICPTPENAWDEAMAQCIHALAKVIRDLLHRLHMYPTSVRLAHILLSRFELMVNGMKAEFAWQCSSCDGAAPVTTDQYLLQARESSEMPVLLMAALILYEKGTYQMVYDGVIGAFLDRAGDYLRLINDACGWRRDKADKKPNAVLLEAMSNPGTSLDDIELRCLHRADSVLLDIKSDVEKLPACLRSWGHSSVRLLSYMRDLQLTSEPHHLDVTIKV